MGVQLIDVCLFEMMIVGFLFEEKEWVCWVNFGFDFCQFFVVINYQKVCGLDGIECLVVVDLCWIGVQVVGDGIGYGLFLEVFQQLVL